MLRRFSVNFAVFSIVLDAATVALALFLTTLIRPLVNEIPGIARVPSSLQIPSALYFIFPLALAAIFGSFALYDGKRYIRAVDEFTAISLASLIAAVSMAGVLYLSFRDFSRAQYIMFVAVAYFAFILWRAIARFAFRFRRRALGVANRRIVIVGTGPLGRMVEDRLLKASDADLSLIGFFDDSPAESFTGLLLGRTPDIGQQVQQLAITDVIIALPPHFYEQTESAVGRLNELPVRVWIALGFFDLALYRTATEDFAGLPLLDLRASALDDYERTVKRGFDLAFGFLALVVTLPMLAVASVLITLDDGAPIFFHQQRVGENGRLFDMHKFRTMVVNAEQLRTAVETRDSGGNLIHKSKNDPRVTRIGRVLRRFSLDELPQLFNVLKGEMSLVGPRPELPHLVQQYKPWQRKRLAVPPGITGWWQVTGRSDKVMHLHTQDDLYYLQNYSIWLDLRIILRTVWVVLLGRGAY